MNKQKAKVAIIVLTWNGWKDTLECLESIEKLSYRDFQVVIYDNGSTDDSVERIRGWIGEKSKYYLVCSDENLGFAKGNNRAAEWANENLEFEYLLFINNDVTVAADFLEPMLEIFEKKPQVGLVGPKIFDYYSKTHWQGAPVQRLGVVQYLMFLTPLKHIFTHSPLAKRYQINGLDPIKVYGIPGCVMLFSNAAFMRIKGFDDRTFLGWEEYIIAEKLLSVGLETWVVPTSRIFHKVGQWSKVNYSRDMSTIFLDSEKIYQRDYRKMNRLEMALIKTVKIITYTLEAIFRPEARKALPKLLKKIGEL